MEMETTDKYIGYTRNLIDVTTLEISGLGSALQAMRLPFSLECRSDVKTTLEYDSENKNKFHSECTIEVNEKDKERLTSLIKNGDEHSKTIRGMVVYARIRAPRFFWSEMDTYKVGTERLSSESTMHTLGKRDLTINDFSVADNIIRILDPNPEDAIDMALHQSFKNWISQGSNVVDFVTCADAEFFKETIRFINHLAQLYRDTNSSEVKLKIKECLPDSFMQTRIQYFSYQTLRRIYKQRKNHRLPHWHKFCEWIETLPLADELITIGIK